MKINNACWLDFARRIDSPNFDERPAGQEISLLVIHSISLPPGEFNNSNVEKFFTNQLDESKHIYFEQIVDMQVSAHLFIRRNGELQQFVGLDKRAWHAGQSQFKDQSRCNDFSIGIELEGTDETPYTNAQYDQLVTVTKAIQQRYPAITIDRITGHCDIAPGRKTDPGPFFDWDRYHKALT